MCPLGSRCLDGIQPAAALLGVVPWKGNQREQEEGWTLRRKRLEEGGEARAKTGCHAALAGRGGLRCPPCGCHQESGEKRLRGWAALPPAPRLPLSQGSRLPPQHRLLDPVSRCLHSPPSPPAPPTSPFPSMSKAFSPPASLVISPPHFP